jgi:hypothetical protein
MDGNRNYQGNVRVERNGCTHDDELQTWFDRFTALSEVAVDNGWGDGCAMRTIDDGFDGAELSTLWAPDWDGGCDTTVAGGEAVTGCASGMYLATYPSMRFTFDVSAGGVFTMALGSGHVGDHVAAGSWWWFLLEFPENSSAQRMNVEWGGQLGDGAVFRRFLNDVDADGAWLDEGTVGRPTHFRITVTADATQACGAYSLNGGSDFVDVECWDLSGYDVTSAEPAFGFYADTFPAGLALDQITMEPLP